MNILVTGGAGYIGSATAEALLRAGHAVTVYDSLVTGHREAVPAGAAFVEASLDDRPALTRVLTEGRFAAVMHFAAFIGAGESMRYPGRFYFNNLSNSISLMEEAALAGVKRFVLSSTAAVYRSSDEPLTEDSPLGPTAVIDALQLRLQASSAMNLPYLVFLMLPFVLTIVGMALVSRNAMAPAALLKPFRKEAR